MFLFIAEELNLITFKDPFLLKEFYSKSRNIISLFCKFEAIYFLTPNQNSSSIAAGGTPAFQRKGSILGL